MKSLNYLQTAFGKVMQKGGRTSTTTRSIFILILFLAASVKIVAAGGDFDLKLNQGFTAFPITADGSFGPIRVDQQGRSRRSIFAVEEKRSDSATAAGPRLAILTTTYASDKVVIFPDASVPGSQILVSGLPGSANPHGIAYFGSDDALITDYGNGRVFVVKISTASLVSTINTGAFGAGYDGSGTIAVAPNLSTALAMGEGSNSLTKIQGPFGPSSTMTSLTMPGFISGNQPNTIVFNNAGRAFVYHSAGISVLDAPYTSIAFTFPVSGNSLNSAIAITPDGNNLLTTTGGRNEVRIFQAPFNAASQAIVLSIPFGRAPDAIAIAPDGMSAIGSFYDSYGAFSIAAPFTANSVVASIPLPFSNTEFGFEDVSISADSQIAIITGRGEGNQAVFVRAPFGATSVTSKVPITGVVDSSRGNGSVRFLPPALAPTSCTYSLGPNPPSVPASGGTGFTFSVYAQAGCAWTSVSDDSWITVTSGTTGNGDGTVTYSVAANAGPDRTGFITIAGRIFTVMQATGCTFSINPSEQTFTESGGTGVVNVTANDQRCQWSPQRTPSADQFIFHTSGTFMGSGTFSVTVEPNSTGIGRGGTIKIVAIGNVVAQTFTVLQPTAGCYYTISPFDANYGETGIPADGTVPSFFVEAPPGCAWTADSSASWIRLGSAGMPVPIINGNGNGGGIYSVAPNFNNFSSRTGAIAVAGHFLYVHQQSASCPLAFLYCIAFPQVCREGNNMPAPDHADGKLSTMYGFRDEILSKTPRGKKYTEDYYQYAGEITKLMIFNPSLISRSTEVVRRYQPVVESMLNGERARADKIRSGDVASDQAIVEPTIVMDSELDDLDELFSSFSAQASGQLRQTLDGLRRDIRDPQVQAEFGIQVRRGEKRPLPDDGVKPSWMIGTLSHFDFKSGLEFLNPFSASTPVAETADGEQATRRDPAPAGDMYGQIPLSFEANRGQVDSRVKYLSRGAGYNLFFARDEAVLSLPAKTEAKTRKEEFKNPDLISRLSNSDAQTSSASLHTLRLRLAGANPAPRVKGLDKVSGKSNYFIGNDSGKWRTDIPNYSKVEYKQVYKGVDLIYYGNQRQLEYDFKVAPGADPKTIRLRFAGANDIELDDHGDLLLHTTSGDVRLHAPITYQEINGVRHEIASRYVLRESPKSKVQSPKSESGTLDIGHWTLDSSEKSVGFEVAAYDNTKPLVIDPVLVYLTYLGGSGDDEANSITVDAAGNAYVIGFTDSTNFPVAGAMQPTYGGNPQDVFVSKINPAGTALVYSTYLGGGGQDNGSDTAVDAAGNAYITGYTGSTNFPMASAMQATRTGFYNAFVAKLNPTGSQLIYSTYYGGTVGEFGSAIAVDSSGNAYVGGVTSSPDMPKVNPIQSNYGGDLADAFVAKFNPAGSQIVYATYLGGNGNDGVNGIAIDPTGNAYITGVTFSTNFPTTNPLQENFRGGAFDAFVSKINPSGTALVYSTYLGGTDDARGYRIALDAASNVYIAGQTLSPNFPTAAALQPTFGGGSDAFITKLNPAGAITYSTFLGGSGLDGATGLAVNPAGNAYLTGFTTSPNFPLADPTQPLYSGGEFDGFVAKLNAGGTALAYSTYLGGSGTDAGFDIAVDSSGNGYVFGRTASTNFPTVRPIQPRNGGGSSDLFISKFAATVAISGRVTTPSGAGLRNSTVVLTDSMGVRRTATTSSFGFYQFENVAVGASYVISILSRSYRFAPRTVQVTDSLTNVDFVGLE